MSAAAAVGFFVGEKKDLFCFAFLFSFFSLEHQTKKRTKNDLETSREICAVVTPSLRAFVYVSVCEKERERTRVTECLHSKEQYGTENVLQSTAHCTGLPGEGCLL